MSDNQVSDILAQAFAAEGVDTLFTLMGDANMYWSASMAENQKVRLIHARHEHCCVAMADAYARATGKVGVGSVTCGPGYTQIMTALAMAARGNAPVVVFAGDAPVGASWYIQSIDQAPLALATGAHFVPIRTIDRALDCVREAFYVARMWGTDWTRAVGMLTYEQGVEAFRVTDRLSESERAALMGGTLQRVYNWYWPAA